MPIWLIIVMAGWSSVLWANELRDISFVTLHDFSIHRAGDEKGGPGRQLLILEATAKTYRYLDEEEGS